MLAQECQFKLLRGEVEFACEESNKLMELGKTWNNSAVIMISHLLSMNCCFHLGDFEKAHAHAQQGLSVYDPMHAPDPSIDPQIYALTFSFRSLVYLGYLDEARRAREQPLALARERKHAHALAAVLTLALMCDGSMQSDPATMLRLAEEQDALCVEYGLANWSGLLTWCRGFYLSTTGHAEDALPYLMEVEGQQTATGVVAGRAFFFNFSAETFGKAGRPAEGLKKLEESGHQIETTQERGMESDCIAFVATCTVPLAISMPLSRVFAGH